MPLHGAGVYYFALTGAKEQPIFQSVFEYEYALEILSSLRDTRLLAFVLDDHLIQCVLRCQRDWTEVLDDMHSAFDALHERCWNKRRQVLSAQATVLLIDEHACLSDLILQLHDWPRYTGKVADANLWPWSSDRWYREPQPPAWIDTESMLNLLAHSRRNRSQHYAAVMQQPIGEKFDLRNGNHPQYLALARDMFIGRHVQEEARIEAAYTRADVQRLFGEACELVALQFGLSVADLQDKNQRRRFHHLMPLVIWLLHERHVPMDEMARCVDEDEVRLQLWLRNLPADHTDNIRHQLIRRWQPQAAISA